MLNRRMTLATMTPSQANSRTSIGRRSLMVKPSARNSSIRRSSIMGGGRQTMKDPRPISDKSYISSCIRNLIRYLTEHGYDALINPKILTTPTSKDFSNILEFLVRQLDHNFRYQPKASLHEQVPILFKRLKYPFTISKSALQAVGSPHTWPALLAALTWLVELLVYDEDAAEVKANQLKMDDDHEKLFFDYLCKAYGTFLDGEDDYDVLDAELAKIFDDRNRSLVENTESDRAQIAELDEDIARMRSAPNQVEILTKRKKDYVEDISKFKKLIAQLQQHKTMMEKKVAERTEELAEKEKELQHTTAEKEELTRQLKTQELNAIDVQRIHMERQQLEDGLKRAARDKDSLEKNKWEIEVAIAKQIEATVQVLQEYHKAAEKLQLVAPNDKHAALAWGEPTNDDDDDDYPAFHIEFDPHRATSQEMLGVDMKHRIKPAFRRLREHFVEQTREASNELHRLKESRSDQDGTRQETDDVIRELQLTLEREEAAYKSSRQELTEEWRRREEELSQLLNSNRELKSGSLHALSESQRAVDAAHTEYNQLKEALAQEAETRNNCLEKTIIALTEYKEHIQDALGEAHNKVMGCVEEIATL